MRARHEDGRQGSSQPDPIRRALRRCADGVVPANVALTHLFMAARDEREARQALAHERERLQRAGNARAVERVSDAIEVWRRRPDAFAVTREILKLVDHGAAPANPADAVAHWADAFDRVAGTAPEAGVALYALGDPHLLDAATRELVGRMREWGLMGDGAVLDLGCGNGRVLDMLAPNVRSAIGIDVSLHMLRAARQRCARHHHIFFVRPSGRDLSLFADRTFDLVYAIDVFPYLVLAGLAGRTLAESLRVLRPGGRLLILNYSYRNDDERDSVEVARAAHDLGLIVLRDGTRDLALWDGRAFLLQCAR